MEEWGLFMLKISIKIFSSSVIALLLSFQTAFAIDMGTMEDDIYNHLSSWDTQFKIPYFNSDIIQVIRDSASRDDYLNISLIGLQIRGNGRSAVVNVVYRTTKDEEEYVDSEITNAVNSIINVNMSEFDKVKAINDYLVQRYDYDDTFVSNNSYLALTTGKTTCQGYAMTAYKMFKEAGIESRIVLGSIDGIPHGWNEVKVDGKWYNIDITNNDSLGNYRFFLKSDETLKDSGFSWDDDYTYEPCSEDYVY